MTGTLMLHSFNPSPDRRNYSDFPLSLPAAQECHRHLDSREADKDLAKESTSIQLAPHSRLSPNHRQDRNRSLYSAAQENGVASVCGALNITSPRLSTIPWIKHVYAHYSCLYKPCPRLIFQVYVDSKQAVVKETKIRSLMLHK